MSLAQGEGEGMEWDPLSAREEDWATCARIKALYLRGSQEQWKDVDQRWAAPSVPAL